MSIILKGIDLPQKLYTDIRIYKDGRIKKIIGENIMISYNKNAEAIQIPKDHGRLIDGDKFKETMGDTNMDIYTDEVKEHIDDAPTILEAEEDEC